jgi:hypothetical protein
MRNVATAFLLSVSAAAAAAAAPAAAPTKAAGVVVTEPRTQFKVTVPQGWNYGTREGIPFAHIAMVAPDDGSGANCIIGAEEITATKGATQAQLNEALKTPIGRDTWKQGVFSFMNNIEFESDGVRTNHPSGINAQEAIASGDVTVNGLKILRKLASSIWVAPGMTYSLACAANTDRFNDYRTSFSGIADSFRSSASGSAITASANPAPGQPVQPVGLVNAAAGLGGAPSALAGKAARNEK